jgi:anhydro-N-acetylmuramic acid kinase
MSARKPILALGLMSGTSCDGVDAALIETDGEAAIVCGPWLTRPYAPDFQARLRATLGGPKGGQAGVEGVARELTEIHAEAVQSLLTAHHVAPSSVAVIGFHGQTILHEPHRRRTWQIGDGALLARLTGIDVVNDFRSRDVAEGGQGAPLVPLYHAALAAGLPRPLAVLNVGGVANVTWIGREGTLIAFDTGPGNALIDDWMLHHTGKAVDADGAAAAAGRIDEAALSALFMHAYFNRLPPKSLDRNAFPIDPVRTLPVADGAATLAAFTAAAIARAREHFPEEPQLWVICGGGRRNRTLMAMIAARVESAVVPAEAVGFDGDAMEAEAWAYLAVRSLKGLPISFPGTTGVPAPMTGGVLARAGRRR